MKRGRRPKNIEFAIISGIVEDYRRGETIQELSSIYSLCYPRVRSVLIDRGIEIERGRRRGFLDGDYYRKIPISVHKDVIKKYQRNMSASEIAKEYGLSKQGVINILRKYGVKIRRRGFPNVVG